MTTNVKIGLAVLLLVLLAAGGYCLWRNREGEVVERIEYREAPDQGEFALFDDSVDEKNPVYDENLVDSRPIGEWEINQSGAVIRLDCPAIRADKEKDLLELRASYYDVLVTAKQQGLNILPSANMADGAAKQFDDGLYAALDLACFEGRLGFAPAVPDFLKNVLDKLSGNSPARPFIAAALELAGKDASLSAEEKEAKKEKLAAFEQNEVRSKPIGFYTWSRELERVWRCLRLLQEEFEDGKLEIPRELAAVLKENPALLKDYRAIKAFYDGLTNPAICIPVDALIDSEESLRDLAERLGVGRAVVSILPPSTSRETELFDRLFGGGPDPSVNMMAELMGRIRAGEVDLAPRKQDGWYAYQAYALETLLLPSRGEEKDKLLLTAKYKKRLLEAFQAMLTKHRETHVRQLAIAGEVTPLKISPRLRIEPCVTFYLRAARAYGFLGNFLSAVVGEERLKEMRGLKQGGMREMSLWDEWQAMRKRFYGFYLVSCEDIGLRPHFMEDEPVEETEARKAGLDWLETWYKDPDLACDTRAIIPIYIDPSRQMTRHWAVLGVRLAKLHASYALPPQERPEKIGGPWQDCEPYQLDASDYVIPVDAFAEIELKGNRALTREEFRAVCDRHKTQEAIQEALSAR
ncbi:MAG: hypothetical protein V1918_08945 [Planctomycetota bacterium]